MAHHSARPSAETLASSQEYIGVTTREKPGCGIAAFAARRFDVGDTVLRERALVVSAVGVPQDGNRCLWRVLAEEERSRRLSDFSPGAHIGAITALRKLGVAGCRERLLTKCTGPKESLPSHDQARRDIKVLRAAIRKGLAPQSAGRVTPEEYAALMRVFEFNGFRFNHDLEEGQPGYDVGEVVFDEMCRINHSCEPNCSFDLWWCEESETVTISVKAKQPLQEGDEVNISYLPQQVRAELSSEERRQRLRQHWLFDCGCVRCHLEGRQIDSTCAVVDKLHSSSPCNGDDQDLSTLPSSLSPRDSLSSSTGICWEDLGDPEDDNCD